MKKFFSVVVAMIAIFATSFAMSAQTVESSRFTDNWSVGVKGGITTPLHHAAFWGDARPVVGIELTKAVTPILSLGVEGAWTVNTSPVQFGFSNHLAFDRQYVGALTKVNLMNAIGGFNGSPRLFEMELVGGTGWQHDYFKDNDGVNSWHTKWGVNFNFNIGSDKAWTLSFKPDVVFDMMGREPSFNKNRANLELVAGVTYHFKNHNGTHSFVICDKKFTQEEWDALNGEVNSLRERLNECENRQPVIIEKEIIIEKEVTSTATLAEFPTVNFDFNSAEVSADNEQMLIWVAKELSKTNSKVLINGFASEEGNAVYNEALSLKRAEAVKAILVQNGVNANRIETVGNGATTQFGSELANNRIVITTL